MEPIPNTAQLIKNLRVDSPGTKWKSRYYYYYTKECSNNMTFYIIFLDECLAQLSSELFPPLACGNRYRDSHQENIQRVRDLGTPNTKWDVSNKTLLSRFRDPYRKKRQREYKSQKDREP